jgi:hypothetical protein
LPSRSFSARFGEAILAEVRRNVLAKRDVDPTAFDRTLTLMNNAFDDAMVEDWEPLVVGLDLPDPDDRHVLAAAIAGGAQSIATFNLVDFPVKRLVPHNIEAVHPDTFLLDQLDLAPATVLAALRRQAGRLRKPPTDLSGLTWRSGVPGAGELYDFPRGLMSPDPVSSVERSRLPAWRKSVVLARAGSSRF